MDCRTALLTILDQVDYTSGACGVTEMVGAVLPKEVITLCRQAVEQSVQADGGESLPTLASLKGIAPNATGDQSSEDFIANIRSGG